MIVWPRDAPTPVPPGPPAQVRALPGELATPDAPDDRRVLVQLRRSSWRVRFDGGLLLSRGLREGLNGSWPGGGVIAAVAGAVALVVGAGVVSPGPGPGATSPDSHRFHCLSRLSSLRALRWCHVDLSGNRDATMPVPPSISVLRSVRAGGDTKTRRSRRARAMPQRCVDALSALWDGRRCTHTHRAGEPLTSKNALEASRSVWGSLRTSGSRSLLPWLPWAGEGQRSRGSPGRERGSP